MAVVINDFTITEWVDFEAYKRDTGYLDFRLEDMQDFTINATQDKTELTGKNGRVIGYKKQNKAMNGEGTYGMVSAGLLKAQTGGEITTGTQTIKKSEVQIIPKDATTITTEATATGTDGAEIGLIRVLNSNGSVAKTYEQGATASATKFAYDPTTKTLTLPTGDGAIAAGTKIEFAYTREVDGTKVTDPSDSFSETREVWIHCFGKDACDNEYYIAIHVPRADFSGEFSLDLGGDQVVHNFSFDAMVDLCNATSTDKDLFDVIVYTGDEETTNP